jgi:hypothetical protein
MKIAATNNAIQGLKKLGWIQENVSCDMNYTPKRLEDHKNINKIPDKGNTGEILKLENINKNNILYIKYLMISDKFPISESIGKQIDTYIVRTDIVKVINIIDEDNITVQFVSNRECPFENEIFIISINDVVFKYDDTVEEE